MTEPKFKIGDEVYVVFEHGIDKGKIKSIENECCKIIWDDFSWTSRKLNDIYLTLEEADLALELNKKSQENFDEGEGCTDSSDPWVFKCDRDPFKHKCSKRTYEINDTVLFVRDTEDLILSHGKILDIYTYDDHKEYRVEMSYSYEVENYYEPNYGFDECNSKTIFTEKTDVMIHDWMIVTHAENVSNDLIERLGVRASLEFYEKTKLYGESK